VAVGCDFKLLILKHAILIHLLDWKYDKKEFIIDDDISFIDLDGHQVKTLYHSLCQDTGVDDGDPFIFGSALLLDDNKDDHSIFPSASPGSISSTFLNLLTIIHGGTVGHCRIISSKDNFITSWGTYELYDALSEGVYDLQVTHKKLDQNILHLIQKICTNLKATAASNTKHARISNALSYFYLAWNVHTFEQTAIGLSIVMETLFSPHSNTELSHQVSYNIAKFTSKTKKARQETYKMVKKYYAIRSKIVHGDSINNDEYASIPIFFKFISSILIKILSDNNLIILFNDNKLRKQYLDDLLFE
jgi:hypothetical protein